MRAGCRPWTSAFHDTAQSSREFGKGRSFSAQVKPCRFNERMNGHVLHSVTDAEVGARLIGEHQAKIVQTTAAFPGDRTRFGGNPP